MIFEGIFIITQIGPVLEKLNQNQLPYHQQFISMRASWDSETEPSHNILFSRKSIEHVKHLKVGDKVKLGFKITCSISLAKIPHTHINPVKCVLLSTNQSNS